MIDTSLTTLLLKASSDDASECLRELTKTDRIAYTSIKPSPAWRLHEVYEVRAGTNSKQRLNISGFESLLTTLASMPHELICTFQFTSNGKSFVIFTTASMVLLVGILIIPLVEE